MMKAMSTKMSPENVTLFHLCNLLSTSETVNYPGAKLVGVAFKLRKEMKKSRLCVHALIKTLNLVISRCCFKGDGKEMHQNLKRTYRAIVFLIKPIVL